MTMTDQELDDMLAELPQLAPRESLWEGLERHLLATGSGAAPPPVWRRPVHWGIAALLIVGVALFLMRVAPPAEDVASRQALATSVADSAAGGSDTGSATVRSTSQPQGRYARHLYSGDEAVRDALLEDELQRVEQAMLYAAPTEQRTLWQYRVRLIEQLVRMRYETGVTLYEF